MTLIGAKSCLGREEWSMSGERTPCPRRLAACHRLRPCRDGQSLNKKKEKKDSGLASGLEYNYSPISSIIQGVISSSVLPFVMQDRRFQARRI